MHISPANSLSERDPQTHGKSRYNGFTAVLDWKVSSLRCVYFSANVASLYFLSAASDDPIHGICAVRFRCLTAGEPPLKIVVRDSFLH